MDHKSCNIIKTFEFQILATKIFILFDFPLFLNIEWTLNVEMSYDNRVLYQCGYASNLLPKQNLLAFQIGLSRTTVERELNEDLRLRFYRRTTGHRVDGRLMDLKRS